MSTPDISQEPLYKDMDVVFLRRLLPKLKNASILLGIMYFLSFLLLLPIWLGFRKEIPAEMGFLLLTGVSIIVVHLILNWSYYMLVIVPAVASIILFFSGAALWIFAPLIVMPFKFFFSMFGGIGGGFPELIAGSFMKGFSEIFNDLGEVISRFGQFLMIVAGWFWWLNDKMRKIDHKALGFYLLCLAIYGFSSGMTSLQGLIIFLYVWLWVKFKLEEKESDLPSLGILFKIVATLLIIFKVPTLGQFDVGHVFYGKANEAIEALLVFYRLLLTGGLLAFVWRYEWLVGKLPQSFGSAVRNFFKLGDNVLKL